jgi:hypothetical protein
MLLIIGLYCETVKMKHAPNSHVSAKLAAGAHPLTFRCEEGATI